MVDDKSITLTTGVFERNRLWLLKNSLFVPISQNRGDRKCLGDPRKSIVGLPDAILFLLILREGVFQQPRLLTPVCGTIARLHQDSDFNQTRAAAEGILNDTVIGIGCPGEVVDIVAAKSDRLRTIRIVCAGDLVTAGANDVVLWNR